MAIMGVYALYADGIDGRYVGSSISIERRVRTHRNDLMAGKHGCKKLQHAFDLVDGELTYEILEVVSKKALLRNHRLLLDLENRYLSETRGLFNARRSAGGPPTDPVQKAAWIAKVQATQSTPEYKARFRKLRLGHLVSEETRRKISAANKGRVRSRNEIRNHARAMKDPAVRERMRDAAYFRLLPSDDVVRRRAESNRGQKRTPESRLRMSRAQMGHAVSSATRRKNAINKRKLDDAAVRRIRKSYARDTSADCKKRLAQEFGVSLKTIWAVVNMHGTYADDSWSNST